MMSDQVSVTPGRLTGLEAPFGAFDESVRALVTSAMRGIIPWPLQLDQGYVSADCCDTIGNRLQ